MIFDCVVRGGLVATASEAFPADVGIRDGVITAIGSGLPPADHEIDAANHVVVPGAIDVHTHVAQTYDWVDADISDDYESGTRAAAAAGITTILNFAFQEKGQPLRAAVDAELQKAEGRAHVDFGLHIVVTDLSVPGVLDELAPLAADGVASVKIFTVTTSIGLNDADTLRVLQACAGLGLLVSVHAEDEALIAHLTDRLLAGGRTTVDNFPHSRPPITEALATARVAAYARTLDCPVYFVHLSSRAALDAVRDARSHGATIYVETRPTYLYLDESRYALPDGEGGKYVCLPPLRSLDDQQALWDGLRNGEIQTYATDHSPWPAALKTDTAKPFTEIPAGIANLGTSIGMLYAEGVAKGRISLGRFVDLTATNPAKLFGLWPRKGAIAVGADADLVLIDPNRRHRPTAAGMQSRVDYEPYEGFDCLGWPVLTLSRGDVVYQDGAIRSAPGRGRFLPRTPHQPL